MAYGRKTKQNKTKQNKTKQNKTKQKTKNKTKKPTATLQLMRFMNMADQAHF